MKLNKMNRSFLRAVCVGAVVLSASLLPNQASAASFSWVWGDDFNSSLDGGKWNNYTGNFGSSSNCAFKSTNAFTWNGSLYLRVNQAPNDSGRRFTSGGVDTGWRWTQTYGKWEVRAKFPWGFGITGYMGLFAQDGSWPPEVDFAEVIGKENWACHMTQHYDADNKTDSFKVWNSQVGSDFTQMHTYVLEWTPGTLKYYIDGKLFLTQPQRFAAKEMKFALGTGTGDPGSWVDSPDNAASNGWSWPINNNSQGDHTASEMQIEYVNIYKYNP